MKEPLLYHKENLDNLLDMLTREKKFVEMIKERYVQQEKDYLFYLNQYQRAVKAGKVSFDRIKYLK